MIEAAEARHAQELAAYELTVANQAAEIERLRADAERYRGLMAMAVRLSLPHETISMLVTDQAELDDVLKEMA